eukprot:Pgem_evm1s6910
MDTTVTIACIGNKVKGFQIGDEVVADIRKGLGGGFAEYVAVKAIALVKKSSKVTFEQAATVPISGQAAMMGINLCNIKAGDKVFVNGAFGGVGSFGLAFYLAYHYIQLFTSNNYEITSPRWTAQTVEFYNRKALQSLTNTPLNTTVWGLLTPLNWNPELLMGIVKRITNIVKINNISQHKADIIFYK